MHQSQPRAAGVDASPDTLTRLSRGMDEIARPRISAVVLNDPEIASVDTDVLVLGEREHRDATDLVRALADAIPGVRGLYAGRLRNAHQVEALTANLIAVNRRYKVQAGLRVTGL